MEITINNLIKDFGKKRAVDIESYSVNSGEMVGLVGNNGAGKTTLFRLILDLVKSNNGAVKIGEWDVSKSEEWKKIMGAYVDESFLINYLTAEEYFYFLGDIYGISNKEIDSKLVEFEMFMNKEIIGTRKLIRDMSAGNKQKIGIIGALIHNPSIVILDEPFNFLDPSSQLSIKQILTNYNKKTEATILISSHNLNHTVEICNRIALLENGEIIRDIDNANHTAEKELEEYFTI